MNWVDVSVFVEITSLLGTRLGENTGSEPVRFDVSAKLEEKERRTGKVVISFGLTVRTKPPVVKYEVEGNATVTGKDALIAKVLEVDQKSKVPFVLHRVYQHAFAAIYVLASFMGTIYPPPDLLLSSGLGQGHPTKSLTKTEQAETAEKAEVVEATNPPKTAESATSTVKQQEAPAQQPAATV